MQVVFTVLYYLVNIIFIFSSLFLILIILLQEGKGGGLSGAFGGVGTEAFGVKAGGINRFTAILAAVWIGAAILSSVIRPFTESTAPGGQDPTTPVEQAKPGPLTPGRGQQPKMPPPDWPGESGFVRVP